MLLPNADLTVGAVKVDDTRKRDKDRSEEEQRLIRVVACHELSFMTNLTRKSLHGSHASGGPEGSSCPKYSRGETGGNLGV